MAAHVLDPASTLWAFVSSGQEPRFLSDIIYSAYVLKLRGIPTANVIAFTDNPQAPIHVDPFGVVGKLLSTSEFEAALRAATGYRHVVVAVTGHGSPLGIAAATGAISPTKLLAAVRSCPGIAAGAVVLCQCFAGVFNYLDVRPEPKLVLIGGTGLHESLSSPIVLPKPVPRVDGSPGLSSWDANIFLISFFEWLLTRPDVDGDGRATLLDAYRHAGVASSQRLTEVKNRLHVESVGLLEGVFDLGRQLSKKVTGVVQSHRVLKMLVPELLARAVKAQVPGLATAITKGFDASLRQALDKQTAAHRIRLQALNLDLMKTLECLHCHQDPWILHPDLARDIEM